MIQSVYLHQQIVEVLRCFGDLQDVINRILDHCENGDITLTDKPPAPDRQGAARYNIDITNEWYLDMVDRFGATSPQISLRRLLYWFVENEIYTDLQWEQTTNYVSKIQIKINRHIRNITSETQRLTSIVSENDKEQLSIILELLNSLECNKNVE